jgi:hypothetical protein
MNIGWQTRQRDHVNDSIVDHSEIRRGMALMNVPEHVAKLCQALPPDKQEGVLDFAEFLVSRQSHASWTVEDRREIVARIMGCLRPTRISSEALAQ